MNSDGMVTEMREFWGDDFDDDLNDAHPNIQDIFSSVGKKFGYDNVQVSFVQFTEVKIQWLRSHSWIEFKISDYLNDAPADVLKSLAESIFSNIGSTIRSYPDNLYQWITSSSFSVAKRPLWLRRSKNLTRSAIGTHKDLRESYERLVSSGLIERNDSVFFTWTSRPNMNRIGYCSTVMNSVVISAALDSPDVPNYVVDFVVYHELLHLSRGFEHELKPHDSEFRALEKKYPKMTECEAFLKNLPVYIALR